MANAISRAFKETQSEVIVRLISRCNAWVQMELTPIQEIASDRHHCFVSLTYSRYLSPQDIPHCVHLHSISPSSTFNQEASLIAQPVKNPPAMQETLVQFLGQEDLLEKG